MEIEVTEKYLIELEIIMSSKWGKNHLVLMSRQAIPALINSLKESWKALSWYSENWDKETLLPDKTENIMVKKRLIDLDGGSHAKKVLNGKIGYESGYLLDLIKACEWEDDFGRYCRAGILFQPGNDEPDISTGKMCPSCNGRGFKFKEFESPL